MATPGDRFEPPPSPLRPRRRDHSGLTSDYVRRELDPPDRRVVAGVGAARSGAQHPFLYVKRRFGYGKVRYRGLAKNTHIALLLGFRI